MIKLTELKEKGLRGIKLHPEYQQFFVDDEKMKPLYKRIDSLYKIFHNASC